MSTPARPESLTLALASLPDAFRDRVIDAHVAARSAYAEGTFDACSLRVAKFGEVVLRLLQYELTGGYVAFGTRIQNFAGECAKLERLPASAGHESLRVIIPRGLGFSYTLRNKRGIGHVGGDVDANEIDAATAIRVADWVLCELIRFFHDVSLEEAQALLDAIAVRSVPGIWVVGGKRRILSAGLDYKSMVLLLLDHEAEPVPTEDLVSWLEHPRPSDFKRYVLRPLHRDRLVEYDEETETVIISPSGAQRVSTELLPRLRAS